MIANCISRLISPTFLLLICTIFAVSYLKRAERTVSQIPLQDTIFSKFDRDEKWIEWGSLYWSKGARCVSQSPNPNSHVSPTSRFAYKSIRLHWRRFAYMIWVVSPTHLYKCKFTLWPTSCLSYDLSIDRCDLYRIVLVLTNDYSQNV